MLMKRRILRSVLRILAGVAGVVFVAWLLVAQPTLVGNRRSELRTSPQNLKDHVEMLAVLLSPRDWQHATNLEKCADYIEGRFQQSGAAVAGQSVGAHGNSYRNVIGRFGAGKGSKVVIGAHYDACGPTPGADDNASGVAVLLELAELFGKNPPDREIELVAYVLEEPPIFGGELMGSAVHAKSLADEKPRPTGVIVLEMVGYFSNAWGSQSYPLPLLYLMYPPRGNFVALVSRWDQGGWISQVKAGMQGTTGLPVYSIRAPQSLPGIDFSDHRNYWPQGIKALMVTDTAFFRNKAYHTAEDKPDRLDYSRMAEVVVAVYEAVRSLK